MGNQLIKGYDVIKEKKYNGGHDNLWSIYHGTK